MFSIRKKKIREIKRIIQKSNLFDKVFYLKENRDARFSEYTPIDHYCYIGIKENRKPCPDFDPIWYKNFYEDANKQGLYPIIHYALYGIQENRFRNEEEQIEYEALENVGIEFEIMQLKMGIAEAYLIDWDREHQKPKNRDVVSIIIPAYGQPILTDSCLQSILQSDAGLEYEIIVVNNSQNPSDVEALDKWLDQDKIKIIHNEENLNFALGCNLGFSRSIGSRVVFLNNDTTVTDGWLANLLSPLGNPNISITQPLLLYPDGRIQCMGLVFSDKSKLAYPIYQNQDIPEPVWNKNRFFNAVTGACLAVRADDFALVKGFSTEFVNGQEDVDFCLKLNRLKNTKAMYVADSLVYHYEGKSAGRGKFIANNRISFIKRWGEQIIPDDTPHYTRDGMRVIQWNLDSESFKKLGIENYIPEIQYERDVVQ